MKKVTDILLKVFGIGVCFCLFAGGFSILGYVVALIIGGETATAICTFIFKKYLPLIIRFTSIFTGVGLLGMYLSHQKALTAQAEDIHNVEKQDD